MNAMKVGLVIGSVLALQACATGGASREAGYSDADKLIIGVMTSEEQSCSKNTIKYCTGSGKLSMQCSCESPDALATTLAGYSGYYFR